MKKISYLLFTICMLFVCTVTASAINDEFVLSETITLPIFETPNQYIVLVYDESTDYDLYSQWVKITKSQYDTIKAKLSDMGDAWQEYDDWKFEEPVSTDFNSDGEYRLARQSWERKDYELEQAYEQSKKAYYDAYPNFDDTKWKAMNDNEVELPSESYNGLQSYVLFIKFEDHENSLTKHAVGAYLVEKTATTPETPDVDEPETPEVEEPETPEGSDPETPEVEKPEGPTGTIDDANWEKLKDAIKQNETIGLFNNEEARVSFDDTNNSTETSIDTFTIIVEHNSNSYNVVLNYNKNTGVMTYNVDRSSPKGYEGINSLVMVGVLEEYCALFNYDNKGLLTWMNENQGKLTLTGNGIEYSIKEYNYENNGEGYDFSLSGEYFESLSINIAYPLTGFTNQAIEEEKEPNPGTGDLSMVVIAGAMLICAGASFVVYRKMKQN